MLTPMKLAHESISLALFMMLVAGQAWATNPSFHIVGSEQNVFSPTALSGDGNRVVGIVDSSPRYEAAYVDWRTSLTPVYLQQGSRLSPVAASFDGSVIVGTTFTTTTQPFRWIQGTLSYVPPPVSGFAYCSDVSGDGSTLVGRSYNFGVGDAGAVWNANAGWSFLPQLPMANCNSRSEATAISGNGAVIAGSAHHCGDHGTMIEYEAVTWNPTVAGLGWSEDAFTSYASKVSSDGSTVVGMRIVSIGGGYMAPLEYTPCRWTSAGVEYLAPGQIDLYSYASDVNGDGSMIVGRYDNRGFLWIEDVGRFDLTAYAMSLVGDLGGWVLINARAISDDGTVIIGEASRGGRATTFVLDLGSPCIADYNHDGIADFFDYLEFVQDFSLGSMSADVNRDLVIDMFDYLDFVQIFASGC